MGEGFEGGASSLSALVGEREKIQSIIAVPYRCILPAFVLHFAAICCIYFHLLRLLHFTAFLGISFAQSAAFVAFPAIPACTNFLYG